MSRTQMQRTSLVLSSEASYCEREPWDDWGSRSSLTQSQPEEVATQAHRHEDAAALRAERDALARTLAAERQRAAAAARAHDARLAELHGVIAELMRRRAQDKQTSAILEEELSERSDECESATQPAGELDNDADRSRTDQNETSSILSPVELPSPRGGGEGVGGEGGELPDDDTSACSKDLDLNHISGERAVAVECSSQHDASRDEHRAASTLHRLTGRDSEMCLSTARCCQYSRQAHSGVGSSCERERGSVDDTPAHLASPGRCSSRRAKLASRVRLRRTEDTPLTTDEKWCAEAAEQLSLDVCAQADLREALVTANSDSHATQSALAACRARCARLESDARVLECALARATDTAHRLASACACHESSSVSLCAALLAADQALETYDVLLALAETTPRTHERSAAELVARQLLRRLDAGSLGASIGQPLLSPGPWLLHDAQSSPSEPWSAESEAALRAHAARLKSDTAALRATRPPPHLFTYHDVEDEEAATAGRVEGEGGAAGEGGAGHVTMAEMEAAVMMQEVCIAREERAVALCALAAERARVAALTHTLRDALAAPPADTRQSSSPRRGRSSRERHWLEPSGASETDL